MALQFAEIAKQRLFLRELFISGKKPSSREYYYRCMCVYCYSAQTFEDFSNRTSIQYFSLQSWIFRHARWKSFARRN